MASYIRVKLKPKEEDRLLAGHPWVFANEADKAPKTLSAGTLVEVITSKGAPVGRGVANPTSKILIRLLTRDFTQEIDEAFIFQRVQKAVDRRQGYREKIGTDGLRLLFGEGDGLPGIIADGFGDSAVLSCFSAGLKPFVPVIAKALQAKGYRFIYEKSVGEVCLKEGMAEFQGWLTEPGVLPMPFVEGKATFQARPDQGQKTGFYLDFREARRRVAELSAGKVILDAFCYSGAAAVQAALGGASDVLAMDSSQPALDEGVQAAVLNGVEGKIRFEKGDSFKALREFKKGGKMFDGILLDPPPMAKSAHDLPEARNAFKRLMGNSMDLLNPGGFMVVGTCSHHFSWTLLEGVAREAVEESGRSFRLLERLTQPQDHPIVLSIPETEYLRVLVLTEISY
ncbi:MAG TPA: class I SAM-dependent rRNA methyltransferase [bacterium]|nr:class I SAM-dependent rRNA methyltransferase [bacterium]